MLHFHCRKCARNILTDDGKDKPTFTDGLCENCDPNKQPSPPDQPQPDPRDEIIANLKAQVELLSKPTGHDAPDDKAEKPPVKQKPRKKKGVKK